MKSKKNVFSLGLVSKAILLFFYFTFICCISSSVHFPEIRINSSESAQNPDNNGSLPGFCNCFSDYFF
jgi:hypothetical protein